MTSRERFLRYCKENGLLPGTVLTEIWKAAERQALERAALHIEARALAMGDSSIGQTMARIYNEEARGIRALIDAQSKEGS